MSWRIDEHKEQSHAVELKHSKSYFVFSGFRPLFFYWEDSLTFRKQSLGVGKHNERNLGIELYVWPANLELLFLYVNLLVGRVMHGCVSLIILYFE